MTPNRLARSALAASAVALAAVSFAPAASAAKKRDKDPTLKVMTRNIYLGGNIFLPIGAPDRATFEAKTQELWNQIRFTNFPARAKLLAKEVKRTKPDLIGLQEVATWRRSPNGVKDGSATPSTQVVYDFLKTLQRRAEGRGPEVPRRGRPAGGRHRGPHAAVRRAPVHARRDPGAQPARARPS